MTKKKNKFEQCNEKSEEISASLIAASREVKELNAKLAEQDKKLEKLNNDVLKQQKQLEENTKLETYLKNCTAENGELKNKLLGQNEIVKYLKNQLEILWNRK